MRTLALAIAAALSLAATEARSDICLNGVCRKETVEVPITTKTGAGLVLNLKPFWEKASQLDPSQTRDFLATVQGARDAEDARRLVVEKFGPGPFLFAGRDGSTLKVFGVKGIRDGGGGMLPRVIVESVVFSPPQRRSEQDIVVEVLGQ